MLVDLSAVHVNLLASMSSKAELMVERANGKADATAALGHALQGCASHDDVSDLSALCAWVFE